MIRLFVVLFTFAKFTTASAATSRTHCVSILTHSSIRSANLIEENSVPAIEGRVIPISVATWRSVSKAFDQLLISEETFRRSLFEEIRKIDPNYKFEITFSDNFTSRFKNYLKVKKFKYSPHLTDEEKSLYPNHPDNLITNWWGSKKDLKKNVKGLTRLNVRFWLFTLHYLLKSSSAAHQQLISTLFPSSFNPDMIFVLPQIAHFNKQLSDDRSLPSYLSERDSDFFTTEDMAITFEERKRAGITHFEFLDSAMKKDGYAELILIPIQKTFFSKQSAIPTTTNDVGYQAHQIISHTKKLPAPLQLFGHSSRIDWEHDEDGVTSEQQMIEMIGVASQVLTPAVRQLQISMHIPETKIHVVFDPMAMPSHYPIGYDRSSKLFWTLIQKKSLAEDIPALAIEFGRFIFVENLKLHSEKFRNWDDSRWAWIDPLSTLSRISLLAELARVDRPVRPLEVTKDSEALASPFGPKVTYYPWAKLTQDYEIAFGVLFAAAILKESSIAEITPLEKTDFFKKQVMTEFNIEEDDLDLRATQTLAWETPTPNNLHKNTDPYHNKLRLSIREIWSKKIHKVSYEDRLGMLKYVFLKFVSEIERRHQEEVDMLVTDSVINRAILEWVDDI